MTACGVLLLGALGLLWPEHVEEMLAAPLYADVVAGRPGALAGWLALDALVNAAAFGALAVALAVLLRSPWWFAAAAAATAGCLVELTQLLLPGRTADPNDVFSDAVGALLGGLVLRAVGTRSAASAPVVAD